jgi:Xaa-Pro aminopeptidase
MHRHGIDAYIIPGSDAHLSEYVPERWKGRQWISGFTGSAGTVAVTAGKAGLWTDSRYFLQAAAQLEGSDIRLYKTGLPDSIPVHEFLLSELKEGAVAGLDGQSYSAAATRTLQKQLSGKHIRLETSADLLNEIWEDRPPVPDGLLFELPEEIAGQSVRGKREAILHRLRQAGADALLLCALDEVAWTFNVRGNDVDYNPVALAYAFVSEKESVLFVSPAKLTQEIAGHLVAQGVTPADYGMTASYLSRLAPGLRIFLDPDKTPEALCRAIPSHCRIVEGITPANHLKSVKNPVEIDGFRSAMLKDGVALTRFHIWLEKQLAAGERLTEISITEKLSSLRAEQPLYVSDSFRSICGYGPHGAIVHYSATPDTDATLLPEGILLMDSGAQYLDGTTDITRTVALGEPSEAMKKDFTLVLKGHIALATCKFPAGMRGSQLDILARKPQWDAGMNYLHGTGHGVGHCLNVHEGPQSIRMEENPETLRPGMVMSNEPGIYRTGRYGIRTENMMAITKDSETEYGEFLSFDTLTLCHIDSRLIIPSMLSAGELAWLNTYHRTVYEKLAPRLDEEEREWLKKKTTTLESHNMALIKSVRGFTPRIGKDTYLADNAVIIGDVEIGEGCSIWFGTVLRGDVNSIRIGNGVNIQDGSVLHTLYEKSVIEIGNNVSVGHNVTLHGAKIGDGALVGMGAVVLDHAVVGEGAIIAAGSVVLSGTVVEPGSIYAGVPANFVKKVDPAQSKEMNQKIANNYHLYASWYKE